MCIRDSLGYEKHERTEKTNARNGHTTKTIKTSAGESKIAVPRDRDGSFTPVLVPKRKSMVEGIENVIISLYAKGMSVNDIEQQIKEVYNFDISSSTISRITDRIVEDIAAVSYTHLDVYKRQVPDRYYKSRFWGMPAC